MNDLLNAGLNLRTLEVRELHELVADLNFNFIQILQLPGFKGIPGDDGAAITGPAGARGNFWIFAMSASFIAAYPSITTANEVTRSFINGQITTDLPKLLLTLDVTEFVDNDIIVLPSRDVIQFDATTGEFNDTGIRFADGFSLSEQDVIQIVNNILNGIPNTDIWTSYQGIAKNHSDLSPGVNTELNSNSIIDIPVIGAGPGVIATDFIVSALKEAVISSSTSNMMLTGAPQLYHEIVQRTQDNLTNDYLPGVDDYAALAVMQNSYQNGIIMGHKTATTMAEWARIYKTESVLRLLSNYNPVLNDAGRIDISLEKILTYSNELDIVTDSLKWVLKQTQATLINADANKIDIGAQSIAETCLRGGKINLYSTLLNNSTHNVLALVNNELIPSSFQPDNTSIQNNSSLLLTHNLLWDYQQLVNTELTDLDNRLDVLENQSNYTEVSLLTATVNFNTLVGFGTYAGFKNIAGNSVTNIQNAPFSFSNWVDDSLILKVNRLHSTAANRRIVEQELVFQNSIDNSSSATAQTWKRIGTSLDTAIAWTFTPWTRELDSTSTIFSEGTDIDITETETGRNRTIVISHEAHPVSSIGSSNQFEVLQGFDLDATGHPTTSIIKDLRDDFYTEDEVDALIANQNNWDEEYFSFARFNIFVNDLSSTANGLANSVNVPANRFSSSKNINSVFVQQNNNNRLRLFVYFQTTTNAFNDLYVPELLFRYNRESGAINSSNNSVRAFQTATLQWSYELITAGSTLQGVELMIREDSSIIQWLDLNFNFKRLP